MLWAYLTIHRFLIEVPSRLAPLFKLENAFGCMAALSWIAVLTTFKYLEINRPSSRNPSLGYIVPMNDHGTVFYVSWTDDWTMKSLIVMAALFVLGLALVYWKKRKAVGLR